MRTHSSTNSFLRRGFAKAAVTLFLLTVTSPVLAMSQIEGRSESRTVFVQTEALRRRRRALDRYYAFPESTFAFRY